MGEPVSQGMGASADLDERSVGTSGCLSVGGESGLCSTRAEKFHAVARLFDLDITRYRASIERLLEPCEGFALCAMETAGVREAGEAALAWVDNVYNESSVQAEHLRLFGSPDPSRAMPSVSPLGSMYESSGKRDIVSRVEHIYAERGFVPTCMGGHTCPTHIANELDFMGHCLRGAVAGDGDCAKAAQEFVSGHLASWGVLFSAAVYSMSRHPVTRFAGLSLEHLLLCETDRVAVQGTHQRTLDA